MALKKMYDFEDFFDAKLKMRGMRPNLQLLVILCLYWTGLLVGPGI